MKIKHFEEYQDFIGRVLLAEKTVYLSPEEKIDYLEKYSDKDGKNKALTKTVTFQVTDRCNLCCSYCYQINKHTNSMPFEIAKKFIDLMFEDYEREGSYLYKDECEAIVIEFIGGEPLLEIELIDQITDYFMHKAISLKHPWANNVMFSMISNGLLYFDEKVQDYIKKNNEKLSFGISVDGCKELHDMCRVDANGNGSYDKAAAACLHYKEHYNPEMLTKMTIAPANVEWVFKAIKNLIENLHYEMIHCNCVYEKGWTAEHAKELYKQLKLVSDYLLDNNLEEKIYISILYDTGLTTKKEDMLDSNYCGSTGSMLACDPFGKIFPCIRFMDTSLGNKIEPFILGDVDNGIGILPKHKDKINILDSITLTSQSTDECINCPIQGGCGWCTGYNYQETGTPNKRVTYYCIMHKAEYMAASYFWNKAHKKHNEEERFDLEIPKEWALEIIDEDEYNMLLELSK